MFQVLWQAHCISFLTMEDPQKLTEVGNYNHDVKHEFTNQISQRETCP